LEYLQQINSIIIQFLILENSPQKVIVIFDCIQGRDNVFRGVTVFVTKNCNFSHFAFLSGRIEVFGKLFWSIINREFLSWINLANPLPLNLLSFSCLIFFSPGIVWKDRGQNGRKYLILEFLFGRLYFEIFSAGQWRLFLVEFQSFDNPFVLFLDQGV
jgi:hypothetical protein